MNANAIEALELLASATRELLANSDLSYAVPGERNVVSELFFLLRPRFPQYTVSNEYDRREQEVKMLGDSKIIPDLIVHRVGDQNHNLLVVEIKLLGNYDFDRDARKLRGLTDLGGEYRYAVGVHLVLDMARSRVIRGNVYVDGIVDDYASRWLEGQMRR
ncbi:hypothetical protein [Pseudoxanthomonas mexicana]|uniref:hypothetical protein n=1 Tax=Pseudoxanthomonas mexicana TaxID=128785 RepID=UPI0028A8F4D0|nr:hypothetical protein [Pseudoxanthomonas mexicana]